MGKIPQFNRVFVLSPVDAITGGPEALHQLAYSINQLGGDARMAYYSKESMVSYSENFLSSGVDSGAALEAYSKYEPVILKAEVLEPDDLIIFPEVLASAALAKINCRKAIWWLSVDNAMNSNPLLKYPRIPNALFQDRNLMHFYQSAYARNFLIDNDVKKIFPLFDFINIELATLIYENFEDKVWNISIFPRKGAELASKFFENGSDFKFNLIQNMTREEVGVALRSSSVYIDFGNQPGKDRVPREAAVCGNIVFAHCKGAGSFFEDNPLDDFYLFTEMDILTGDLNRRVKDVLENPSLHFKNQSYYRERVFNEQEEFMQQAKTLFFSR